MHVCTTLDAPANLSVRHSHESLHRHLFALHLMSGFQWQSSDLVKMLDLSAFNRLEIDLTWLQG
jgi:hypothetical protein